MFSIGTVAQLTGLSPNGIRYYEERHLVSPERGANGKYRDFGVRTLSELMDAKNFRGCGFSLDEASNLSESNLGAVADSLARRADSVDEQIRFCQRLAAYLRRRASGVAALAAGVADPQERIAPETLWLPLEQEGGLLEKAIPRRQVRAWLELAPFVDSCLLFDPQSLGRGEFPVPSLWGLGVETEDAVGLDPAMLDSAKRFPGGLCLVVPVEIDEALCLTPVAASRIRRLLDETGVTPAGRLVSRRLTNLKRGGALHRFDEVWIPLGPGFR